VCVFLLQGQHINTQHLEEMGSKFAEALVKVRTRPVRLNGSTSNGVLMLPVPPTGFIDDEYELSFVEILCLALQAGQSDE
jgi:hypothetical protein